MNCVDIHAIFSRNPTCVQVEGGIRLTTDCLYPSSDRVSVFVGERSSGFRVTDGGGAWRSAQRLGRANESMFEKACKRYSVNVASGIIVAEAPSHDWLNAAVVAVANASAMAAQAALEASIRSEKSLNSAIYDTLASIYPKHRIARNYEYRGRSGHVWPIDFAVMDQATTLIKSVSQNGNSINSNYATFGDIGDRPEVAKFSVFVDELKQDSAALLRQVATLVPYRSLGIAIEQKMH